MKTEPTWRWVTRTPGQAYVKIWTGATEPKMNHGTWQQEGGSYAAACKHEFTSATGLTIPTNRPVKVAFNATILKRKAKVKK
jgi:hypothetical protein